MPTTRDSGDPRGVLRVAAIIANESVSGPGRQLAALADALRREHGTEYLILILHRRGNPRPPYAAFLDRLDVPYALVEDRGPLDIGLIGRARSVLGRFQPTLIQSHGYKATALALALRRTGADWPWIGFFHGETHEDLKARFYHWLDRRMLGAADRVVVMSRRQHERFARLGARAMVIYNAVVPDPATGSSAHPVSHETDSAGLEHPILGVVGRLSPEKGVDVLLAACARLQSSGATFSVLIAGDGPESDRLIALARQLGLDRRVRFLGNVHDIGSVYRGIDLLVIPSRSEGLPNVLLEAIAADLPVLATDVGAISEVLADPLAGVVVPPADPTALADAIGTVYALRQSPDARAARAATAAAFSLENRVRQHLRIYRQLVPHHTP